MMSAHPRRPDHDLLLLVKGQVSRWHRVRSDEVWHFYEGDPLELFWRDDEAGPTSRALLGPVRQGESAASGAEGNAEPDTESISTGGARECRPVRIVPADCWQAARTTGAYTLVGCTVGPGFDFADFEMRPDLPV